MDAKGFAPKETLDPLRQMNEIAIGTDQGGEFQPGSPLKKKRIRGTNQSVIVDALKPAFTNLGERF